MKEKKKKKISLFVFSFRSYLHTYISLSLSSHSPTFLLQFNHLQSFSLKLSIGVFELLFFLIIFILLLGSLSLLHYLFVRKLICSYSVNISFNSLLFLKFSPSGSKYFYSTCHLGTFYHAPSWARLLKIFSNLRNVFRLFQNLKFQSA